MYLRRKKKKNKEVKTTALKQKLSDDPLNLSSDSLYLNSVTKKGQKVKCEESEKKEGKKARRKLKRRKCGNKMRRKASLVPLSAAGDCNKLGRRKKSDFIWIHAHTFISSPCHMAVKQKILISVSHLSPLILSTHIKQSMKYLKTNSPSDLSLRQLKML